MGRLKILPPTIYRLEWGVAVAVTLLAVGFHGVFLFHAGGLWRDEVVSLYIATMPSLSDMWANLRGDSALVLLHAILRGWTAMGLGGTDFELRVLGFLIGVGVLAVLWFNARLLGYTIPSLSLVLFGLNPDAIRYGDSLRPYGIGILLLVLTFGLVWKVVESPTPKRLVFATVAAVLSVQCLYQSSFLLLAICSAGVAVTARHRMWKRSALIIAIGVVAALSLLPHVQTMLGLHDFKALIQVPVTLRDMSQMISAVLGSAGHHMFWVWIGFLVFGLAIVVWIQVVPVAGNNSDKMKDLLLFSTTAMVIGTVGVSIYLKIVSVGTLQWHYLPLVAVLAVSLDTIYGTLTHGGLARMARTLVVLLVVGLAFLPVWHAVHTRQTNVDLIASELNEVATEADLILVNPWFCGATFDRYYKGRAPWMTIPKVDAIQLQSPERLRAKLMSPNPMQEVFDGMERALKSGGRIWLIGGLPFRRGNQPPPSLPSFPNGPSGWNIGPYVGDQTVHAAYFIQTHAVRGKMLDPVFRGPVNRYENLSVIVAAGWRSE